MAARALTIAERAESTSKAADTKADSAIKIARNANDTVLEISHTMRAGFDVMGSKIDGLIDDVRANRNSIRPKIASLTEDEKNTRAALDMTRQALENAHAELGRRVRVQEVLEEQRAQLMADIRKRGKHLVWAGVLAFVAAVGTGVGVWTVNEARHVTDRVAPAENVK